MRILTIYLAATFISALNAQPDVIPLPLAPGTKTAPGTEVSLSNAVLTWKSVPGSDGYAVYISTKEENDTFAFLGSTKIYLLLLRKIISIVFRRFFQLKSV